MYHRREGCGRGFLSLGYLITKGKSNTGMQFDMHMQSIFLYKSLSVNILEGTCSSVAAPDATRFQARLRKQGSRSRAIVATVSG